MKETGDIKKSEINQQEVVSESKTNLENHVASAEPALSDTETKINSIKDTYFTKEHEKRCYSDELVPALDLWFQRLDKKAKDYAIKNLESIFKRCKRLIKDKSTEIAMTKFVSATAEILNGHYEHLISNIERLKDNDYAQVRGDDIEAAFNDVREKFSELCAYRIKFYYKQNRKGRKSKRNS